MNFPGKFSQQIMPEKIHILNLSFLADKLNKNFGGTAGNIAYNLALLGEKVTILSSAGKDFSSYKRFLKRVGVETKHVEIYRDDFTANYFAVVDNSDNQIGGFYAGAMVKDKNLSLGRIKEPVDFAIISPTVPGAMVKFARECQKENIPYLFDPGMQLPRLTNRQLRDGILGADILIGNDYEISLIQRRLGIDKKSLLRKVKILITTLAEKGSFIETKKDFIKVKPAKPKKVCDPVGAGDAYRSGFMVGFLRSFDLLTCGQMGSVCAAYTVEKYGTTTHSFTRREFCDRFKKNFKKNLKIQKGKNA